MLCSKCSSQIPNDAVVCPICKNPIALNSGVSKLKIVKVKPRPFFKRKKDIPFERPKKPFRALYKIYAKVDDKEYSSSKPFMEIPVVPGNRKIKISNKSFKLAAVKNFVGSMFTAIGERDAFLLGEYIKFEASDVLSIKGADIYFEENKTLVVYVEYNGYYLDIVHAEVE